MSYQAVIRNSSSQLVINHKIGLQVSILRNSENGPAIYSELLFPKTNENGLISIEIGNETGFDEINWSENAYFLKTEIDPSGGSDYTITGVSQLLTGSVYLLPGSAGIIMTVQQTGILTVDCTIGMWWKPVNFVLQAGMFLPIQNGKRWNCFLD
jgi:hypothetical protein